MSTETKIEWTDVSWSPWRGCNKVSPGCTNCYAETLSKRNPAVLGQWGKGKPRVKAKSWGIPKRLNKAPWVCDFCGKSFEIEQAHNCIPVGNIRASGQLKWHRLRIFPSLCDWLDEEVPIEWLAEFLKLIYDTPNLTWQLLTKRPENWRNRIMDALIIAEGGDVNDKEWFVKNGDDFPDTELGNWLRDWTGGEAPANVWMGVSVENQALADERIPELLKIPAIVRFLSCEPLLEGVDLVAAVKANEACPRCTPPTDPGCPYCLGTGGVPVFHNGAIHWVIIGGESGKDARPCNVAWIQSLVDQCQAAGVPAFVKQLGKEACEDSFEHTTECDNDYCALAGGPDDCIGEVYWSSLNLKHPKGGDPSEWPADLRIRQFPSVSSVYSVVKP